MDPIDFYKAVLPDTGVYCAVSISPTKKVVQTFHRSIEELVERAEAISTAGDNAYFALSTFKDDSSRKAFNTSHTKSFFLDLDCGPGKPYADQSDAAVSLRSFIELTGLPEPTLVNSGYGLHAYWALTEAIPTEKWAPLALRFKQLCFDRSLPIDPAVPADAARVLRCPDTYNYKGDPPEPVQIMQANPTITLDHIIVAVPSGMVDLSAAADFGLDDLTKSVANTGNYPSTNFARIVTRSLNNLGCAQIARAVSEAATLEEPLWRAALSIAWRCTDAEKAIHMLSRDHPEYTPEDTVYKAQLTKGPTTCKWYKENYGDTCKGCKQKVTSPILLGRKVEEAPVVDGAYQVVHQLEPDNSDENSKAVHVEIPTYPYPYFRGVNGGVFKREKDKDGNVNEESIYQYDLYVTTRYFDSDESGDGEGEQVQINLHTPHDGIRRFTAPVTSLMSTDKLRDVLVKNGVIVYGEGVKQIMAYLASSVRNMQKLYAAERTRNQMGWTPDNSGFVVGEIEYTAHGVRLAPPASATRRVAPSLTSKGDLAEWSKIANFYKRPGLEAHAFTVLLGFGAPLLKLCNTVEVRGALINLMSNKGGTGKTTVQMVVNSIFGNPHDLLLKKDDTLAAKIQWLGMMNNIAVTMDEITNISDEDLSAMVYEIPQGRGKHRMESQLNKLRTNTSTWTTFAISSSNSSMYDKLFRHKSVADGELRRMVEIPFNRPLDISKAESDAVFGQLGFHYGLAGPRFISYVVNNMDEVQSLLSIVRAKLDKAIKMDQADRFYSHIYACALVAGVIAVKTGLLSYDMNGMFNYAVELAIGIKLNVVDQLSDTTAVARELIAGYINENINNTLAINATSRNGGTPAPISSPKGPLRMRYEPDTKELWIPAGAIKDVLVSRQVDVRSVLPALGTMGFLKFDGKAQSKRLSSGLVGGVDNAVVRCYCIDAAKAGMTGPRAEHTDTPDIPEITDSSGDTDAEVQAA